MRTRHASDSDEKLNELTSSLEDAKTTVEELQLEPPADVDPASLDRVEDALQDAIAATDELEDQQEEANPLAPNE
jgi:hypothetical protein